MRIDRESQDIKYEYMDGHMYAMAGGTLDPGQEVELASLGLSFPVAAFYELTEVPIRQED